MKTRKLSPTSAMHYGKLILRLIAFVMAVLFYICKDIWRHISFTLGEKLPILIWIIWIWFAIEIVLRFFPASIESMGCQKQFSKNYIPTDAEGTKEENRGVWLTLGVWIALNAIIGILYFSHVIDKGILLLISLFYSVCDMVCILFFCPFQTWFMKNKCCTTCRIYNWDYAMMFTPLVFIRSVYTWSLFGLGVALLLEWEFLHWRYAERFSERTNQNLACIHCKEKLCAHKTQLRQFQKKLRILRKNAEGKMLDGENI